MTEVIINDNIVLISSLKFKEVEDAILAEIRSWNNFQPTESVKIELRKIEDPDALSAVATEEVQSSDIFGRQ